MSRAARGQVRLVARNGAYLLVANVVTVVASLVSVPVLFDQLGEQSYGVWVLLLGVVSAGALIDMGLGAVQVREVALALTSADERRAGAVLALGWLGGAGIGLLAIIVMLVSWPVLAQVFGLGALADQALTAALLLLLGFLMDSATVPWRAMLEGHQRYRLVGLISAGAAVLGAVLAVSTALLGGGLVGLGASVAVTSAVRAALLMFVARRHVPRPAPRLADIRWSDVTSAAGYGMRVQAANAGAVVNNHADRLFLGAFFDVHTVAGFDLGSRLVNLLRMLPSFVLTAFFPAAAGMAERDRGRLDRLYVSVTGSVAAFVAVGGAVLVVCADPLVRLWLGRPVPTAVMTIVILAPGAAIAVAAGAAAMVTRAEGFPGREARCTVLAAALNVALTIPLMWLVGPMGVPLATTLAMSLVTMYFLVYFHRSSRRPIAPVLRVLWPPAATATAAGTVTWLVQPGLPDGPGRLSAGLAVLCRAGITLSVAIASLAALGFFRTVGHGEERPR